MVSLTHSEGSSGERLHGEGEPPRRRQALHAAVVIVEAQLRDLDAGHLAPLHGEAVMPRGELHDAGGEVEDGVRGAGAAVAEPRDPQAQRPREDLVAEPHPEEGEPPE